MSSSAITFSPFHGFRLFEDVVRSSRSGHTAGPQNWSPAVDILETEDAITLTADLPGVKSEDVDIRVENGALTIKGQRKFVKDESVKGYYRIERSYGEFTRSFAFPETVETDKVAAKFENGVLAVTLPKKEASKPRQIKVEVQ